MRRVVSFLVGSFVIAGVCVVAYPLAGLSGGGPLLLAGVAFAVGITAARLVWPSAKNDRALWLMLLAVTVAVTYAYVTSIGTSTLPGSEGGFAK